MEERWARVWSSVFEEARVAGVGKWKCGHPPVHGFHIKKDADCSTRVAARRGLLRMCSKCGRWLVGGRLPRGPEADTHVSVFVVCLDANRTQF